MPFFGGDNEREGLIIHTLAEAQGFIGRATIQSGLTVLEDLHLLGCALVDARLAEFRVQVENDHHRENLVRKLAALSPYFETLFNDWKNLKDALSSFRIRGQPITPREAQPLFTWVEMLRDTALTRGPR